MIALAEVSADHPSAARQACTCIASAALDVCCTHRGESWIDAPLRGFADWDGLIASERGAIDPVALYQFAWHLGLHPTAVAALDRLCALALEDSRLLRRT